MSQQPSPQQPQQQQTVHPAVAYREIIGECQQYMHKIAEAELLLAEHSLVEETLKGIEPSRRAYRLVGDVLVERNVEEVLPSVSQHKDNLNATIQALKERLSARQKEAAELKAKYNLGQ